MHGKRLWLTALALTAIVPFFAPDTLAKKPGSEGPAADPEIVYTIGATRKSGPCLMVMNADGTNRTAIHEVSTTTGIYCPSWSGDGQSVSFVEEDGSGAEPNSILVRLDVAVVDGVPRGSNRTVLVDDVEVWSAAWSPESEHGDRIALIVERTPGDYLTREVRLVAADGGGTPQTVYTPPAGRSVCTVQWSPEADRIAFFEFGPDVLDQAVILDIETNGLTSVVLPVGEDPSDYVRGIAWAKTQDKIAYTVQHTSVTRRIHVLDLETGEAEPLCVGTIPSWSSDDSCLVWAGLTKYEIATGSSEDLDGRKEEGKRPDWRR
jgi:Tol biopolymer transport system component